MAWKWVNGRLVRDDDLAGLPENEMLMASLLDRRDRLEEATKSDRSLFDKTIGAVVRAPGLRQFLDVISRPSYAVNEAVASAIDPNKRGGIGGSALDAAVGAGRGLWGTKKTSNVETLRERGKSGNLYTALGIASDIALDPLTYFGAAPLRAVGSAEKTTAGVKALAEASEAARHIDDVKRFDYAIDPAERIQKTLRMNLDRINAGKTPLRGKELTDAVTKNLIKDTEERSLRKLTDDITDVYGTAKRSRTPKSYARNRVLEIERARKRFNMAPLTTRERNALVNKLASEEAFSLAKAAQKAAEGTIEAKRAGLKLRFGPLSTEVRADNPLVSPVVDAVKNFDVSVGKRNISTSKIVNSSLVQDLNKKFRTEGTFGRTLNESRKLKYAQGVASFDELKTAKIAAAGGLSVDDVVRGLTDGEAKRLYRAYELGDLSQVEETFKSGLRRDDAVELAKYLHNGFWDAELDAGLIPFKKNADGTPVVDPTTGLRVPEVAKVDNYLYHKVKKGHKTADKIKREKHYVKAVAADKLEPAVERTFKTAQDAADKGVEIEQDFRLALINRTAKHAQAMARRNFVGEAMDNFGVTINDSKTLKQMRADGHDLVKLKPLLGDAKQGAAVEYIPDNLYVQREIAEKLKGVETIANNPGPVLQMMDTVMRKWKPAVTVYNPGHHTRNFMSDVFLGYMDGVKNPKWYGLATDITVNKKVGGFVNVGKGKLRKDQLVKLFHETGASPNFIQTEVPNATVGKVGRGVRKVAEGREEIARMAHFFSALTEEAANIKHGGQVTQEVIEAAQRASQRVKKWHLDYADLTDFEKAVMKRIFPFYTWMRKSTPLMIESMVLRPGKVLNFDRTFQGLFQMMGADPGEALPQDLIPDWIREQVYGQLGTSSRGNPQFLVPSMPFAEPFAFTNEGLSGAFRQGLSSLNPIAKAPIELGLGQSTFTGAPLNEGIGNYATNLLPVGRQVSNLISSQDADADQGMTPFINWLTGAGIREVTQTSQRGEIRRQIDVLEAKLAEQGKEYPYKDSRTSAPSSQFVWENGKLVRKSR